jgi:hypothetical protein
MRLPITEFTRLIASALGRHASQSPMDHGDAAVQARLVRMKYLPLRSYTDTTRPDPGDVPAGAVIYNADDGGINVSDGTNWRGPASGGGWGNT